MINSINKDIYVKYGWLLLVLLFFALRLPDFIINAFVPDEVWHTQYMHDIKNISYFNVENYQGHGSAFWYFGALIQRLFNDQASFFVLRIFSLLSLTATAFLVILPFKINLAKTEQQQTLILCAVFILSLPLFWWGGKLIFPEFFQCFLIAFAYYLIYIHKKYLSLAFFALGFCFGLKLHAGAAVAYFVADNFFANLSRHKFHYFIRNFLALIIGFVICNPYLWSNPHVFIANISSNGHYVNYSFATFLNHWGDVLTGRYSEWDLVYFGGVNNTSIPLINLLLIAGLIVIACRQQRLRSISVLIFLLAAIAELTFNQRFLSYYVFTTIILAILLASNVTTIKSNYLNVILFIGILINLYTTIPNVLQNRELSHELHEDLKHAQQHTQCILDAIPHPNTVGVVINNTDMGANSKRETFLLKPLLLTADDSAGTAKDIAFISYLDTDNFFTSNVSDRYITLKPLLGNSESQVDLIGGIEPKLISAFLAGKIQILYLEGKRTRKIDKYAEFIPSLALVLSRMQKKRVELNILYLDDCYGTRVNLLSINKGTS